ADDYKQLDALATSQNEPLLAKFAKAHYTSYADWVVNTYLPSWHIGEVEALALNKACQDYIDHERKAVTTLHPIYGVIAQIPCERLWPWLAEQLEPNSPPHNVYQFWIEENDGYGHSFLLSNTIDSWFADHEDQYDHETALWVLKGSLVGELNMFRSACGEPLMEMPQS
ncbi:MAG: hypothetical protein AAF492_33120, partial [Verrucomicrobiota bacterium]